MITLTAKLSVVDSYDQCQSKHYQNPKNNVTRLEIIMLQCLESLTSNFQFQNDHKNGNENGWIKNIQFEWKFITPLRNSGPWSCLPFILAFGLWSLHLELLSYVSMVWWEKCCYKLNLPSDHFTGIANYPCISADMTYNKFRQGRPIPGVPFLGP